MENLRYWLALQKAPFIGPVGFKSILDKTNDPKVVFDNLGDFFQQAKLRDSTKKYLKNPDWDLIDKEIRWAETQYNHIVTLSSDNYPPLLKEISDAPPLLYVKGNPDILKNQQIAIVGSRNPSSTGKDNAFQFAQYLASQNYTVTSGLALGIDYLGHKGALARKGKTIAVTATGLDQVYPARHKTLQEDIISSGGAVVTEYALGTPAKKEHFPKRNRIISGLSLGVLVVEAAKQSGSLITARLAGEQGRDVFAIPGSIHNPLAKGCHILIRQGAKLVENGEHILEELGMISQSMEFLDNKTNQNSSTKNLTNEGIETLNHVGFEPTSIDMVVERSGLTPQQVSSMLLVLELQGYVESLPGGTYSRIH